MGSMRTSPTPKRAGRNKRGQKLAEKLALRTARAEARAPADDFETEDLCADAEGQDAEGPKKPRYLPTVVLTEEPGCTKLVATFNGAKRLELTTKGLCKVTELAAIGRTHAVIAHVLGVKKSMFEKLLSDHEEVRDAYDLGKGRLEDRFTDSLMRMADYGNIAATIWMEKTRFGRRDNAPVESGAKHVHIHFPDSVSPEQYMASLAMVHADSHQKALAAHPAADTTAEPSTKLLVAKPTIDTSWLDVTPLQTDEQIAAEMLAALGPEKTKVTVENSQQLAQPAPQVLSKTAVNRSVDR
jgi:hypothetical protein